MPSVVIIQEDIGVGSILEASFREEGYIAGVCGLAEQCERMVAERQPDLIVVASVSRATNLRQSFTKMRAYVGRRQLAIIVLGGETLPKPLFDAGADDYLPRPFSVQELLARSNALLERSCSTETRILNHREISLNLEAHRVSRRGREIHLAPTEYRLLQTMLTEPSRLFARREILEMVWNDTSRDERIVDVSIKRLRKSLNIGSKKDAIRTVRGRGYGLQ
ncbi:phosphate regulon transcriptional regulatory protein PhoB [Brucella sp. NBRC 13694]|jgi:two-component system phosphate regulon response regulator PhoB|uniref:winged helix-turn-helix domain-containing protein n=1 Tax=Brucella TaxID=234 RepID=UPI000F65B79D|nr:winged helix-turn-helix domain-containing protein [Brucella anthropi]MCR5943654.1 DNA-binding response regulator [Ochrobactrum sp. XJ1]RRY16059.1 DNA-binding response regulator [Brucella anthropi]